MWPHLWVRQAVSFSCSIVFLARLLSSPSPSLVSEVYCMDRDLLGPQWRVLQSLQGMCSQKFGCDLLAAVVFIIRLQLHPLWGSIELASHRAASIESSSLFLVAFWHVCITLFGSLPLMS